jgi:hypothetical protein
LRAEGFQGQQLIITWDLPKRYLSMKDLHLELTVRYRNNAQDKFTVPIHKFFGAYTYRLMNQEYFDRGGILTYKVEIHGDETVVETWTQQLWAELIDIPV